MRAVRVINERVRPAVTRRVRYLQLERPRQRLPDPLAYPAGAERGAYARMNAAAASGSRDGTQPRISVCSAIVEAMRSSLLEAGAP